MSTALSVAAISLSESGPFCANTEFAILSPTLLAISFVLPLILSKKFSPNLSPSFPTLFSSGIKLDAPNGSGPEGGASLLVGGVLNGSALGSYPSKYPGMPSEIIELISGAYFLDIFAGITASPGDSIAGTISPAPLGPGTDTTPLLKAKPLLPKNVLKKFLFGDFEYSRLSGKLWN